MTGKKNKIGISQRIDARGVVPESWACIDCGINTAPGCMNRAQLEQAFANNWTGEDKGVNQKIDNRSEVYTVKPVVWKAAGMEDIGGCLCIGCLEKRIDRTLVPKDFPRKHPLNMVPGTERLRSRRGKPWTDEESSADSK
jgi:hypothetical protein